MPSSAYRREGCSVHDSSGAVLSKSRHVGYMTSRRVDVTAPIRGGREEMLLAVLVASPYCRYFQAPVHVVSRSSTERSTSCPPLITHLDSLDRRGPDAGRPGGLES